MKLHLLTMSEKNVETDRRYKNLEVSLRARMPSLLETTAQVTEDLRPLANLTHAGFARLAGQVKAFHQRMRAANAKLAKQNEFFAGEIQHVKQAHQAELR